MLYSHNLAESVQGIQDPCQLMLLRNSYNGCRVRVYSRYSDHWAPKYTYSPEPQDQ